MASVGSCFPATTSYPGGESPNFGRQAAVSATLPHEDILKLNWVINGIAPSKNWALKKYLFKRQGGFLQQEKTYISGMGKESWRRHVSGLKQALEK